MGYLKQKRLWFCTSWLKQIAKTKIQVTRVNFDQGNPNLVPVSGSNSSYLSLSSPTKYEWKVGWNPGLYCNLLNSVRRSSIVNEVYLQWQIKGLLVRMGAVWGVGGGGKNFHPFHRSLVHILEWLTFVLIVECPDHGEASIASGTVRPGVAAGPSGLNMKQTHHDQGILLKHSVKKNFFAKI